jgi:ABC-2 type transport system permease protein
MFKDIQYLYSIFTTLLSYLSAIFYTTDIFSPNVQQLFYLNPVYTYIAYFRFVVLQGCVPSLKLHLLCFGYAAVMLILGCLFYKKWNYKFIYYL